MVFQKRKRSIGIIDDDGAAEHRPQGGVQCGIRGGHDVNSSPAAADLESFRTAGLGRGADDGVDVGTVVRAVQQCEPCCMAAGKQCLRKRAECCRGSRFEARLDLQEVFYSSGHPVDFKGEEVLG